MNWSLALRGEPIEYDQTPDDCTAKSYWIALVLTGDEDTAARIISSGVHGVADSGKVFGGWMCAWGIDVVIKSCVALHTDELRKEEGSSRLLKKEPTR